jgi:bifunctional non-homologous end joining protein LigD
MKVRAEKPKEAKRDKRKIEFTHLDKVFWPEKGYTKGDLIDYYRQIARTMLPYLKDRPHLLLRQPNGYSGKSFFQKDVGDMPPDWVKTAEIYSESNEKNINYLVCDSEDSLLYMAQLGCIEINPWNSRLGSFDKPDWAVLDLDPEAIGFDKVIEVAQAVKRVTDQLEIPSYPKTSGKTGIHIFIPLKARYDYDEVKRFAEILAHLVHERVPDVTSLERSPSKRQEKVYVDFLQNSEGQTLAAPYSVRPTKEASVSTPLRWDEVSPKLDPAKFTIETIFKRLDKLGDIWQPVLERGVDIAKILKKIS